MQFAYVMLEWCRAGVSGSDVVLRAVAGNVTAVPETVHPLSGFDVVCDGECESEVHFTVALRDGDDALNAFCDEIRARGFRVKSGMIIPAELARASVREVWDFESRHFEELAARLDAA